MSEWRESTTPCPIDEEPLHFGKCRPCRFYRGASLASGDRWKKGWRINCNYPRDGSHIERPAIPAVFIEGMT